MNKRIPKKTISESYVYIAVEFFLLYSFYYTLLNRIPLLSIILVGLSIVFGSISIVYENQSLNIQKRLLKFISGWLLIIIFFFFFRNWWSVIARIRWCWTIFLVFIICHTKLRLDSIYKSIIIIGLPHVIATLWFFFFRNLYPVMYRVYGSWPSGTRNGANGFKAGITNHYSTNGIYIAMVFLCCFAYTIYLYKKNNKKTFFFSVITLLSFFSLLLTTKRAHMLFSVLAIFLGLIVFARKITVRQFFTVIVALILLSGVFLWAYQKFPEIGVVFERFEDVDAEEGSVGKRVEMWEYALQFFSAHPFMGIGWGGFRETSGYGMNAHNVYIQLLAETGILGFSIYMITMIILVINLIIGCRRNLKRNCYDEMYFLSFVSLLICIFYILYSLSGNCLFDVTFYFFIYTIAATYSLIRSKTLKNSFSFKDDVPVTDNEKSALSVSI